MTTNALQAARLALCAHLRQQPEQWAEHGLSRSRLLLDEFRTRFAEGEPGPGHTKFLGHLEQLHEVGTELRQRIRQLLEEIDGAQAPTQHAVNEELYDLSLCCALLRKQAAELLLETYLSDLESILACWTEAVSGLKRLRDHAPSLPPGGTPAAGPVVAQPVPPASESEPILIVEDRQCPRNFLEQMLRQLGHPAVTARSGSEALACVAASPVALVLLDLLLPGMDGFEVLRRLKADPAHRHLAVLVISNLDDQDTIVRCIEQGAEDYLLKPINQVLLRARINACLEKKRLREQELKQFFPDELARLVATHRELLEGHERETTILFCDIRGFSSISQTLGPTHTVKWVSDVMGRLSDCVIANEGVLVDYLGDELMAMWGAPREQANAQQLACRAAADMVRLLPALNDNYATRLGKPMDFGIGIYTGPSFVGDVGTRRKFKYGPLGNTVNVASRLQGATKYLKARVLLGAAPPRAIAPGDLAVRRLCRVRVVNISQPVTLYQLLVEPTCCKPPESLTVQYEKALDQFEARQFLEATRTLSNLRSRHPEDGPSRQLLLRAVSLEGQEAPGFDGVWDLPDK